MVKRLIWQEATSSIFKKRLRRLRDSGVQGNESTCLIFSMLKSGIVNCESDSCPFLKSHTKAL